MLLSSSFSSYLVSDFSKANRGHKKKGSFFGENL